MARRAPLLGEPPVDLDRFPAWEPPPRTLLARVHRADRPPGWFASDGHGRFDLRAPEGTCYLAERAVGAVIEVFDGISVVPEAEVDARRVSHIRLERGARIADATATRARSFGVTAAIHSTPDYGMAQRWAAALRERGFDGIRYALRNDPSGSERGVALFGAAGEGGVAVVSTTPIGEDVLLEAEMRFGLRVLPLP